MIISVAILSVVSVYILQMFVATKNLSLKSYEIDSSVRISKSIIDLISSGENVEKSDEEIFSNIQKISDGNYIITFDENFKVSTYEPLYQLDMYITNKDNLVDINITMNRLKPYLMDKSDLQISNISSIKMIK